MSHGLAVPKQLEFHTILSDLDLRDIYRIAQAAADKTNGKPRLEVSNLSCYNFLVADVTSIYAKLTQLSVKDTPEGLQSRKFLNELGVFGDKSRFVIANLTAFVSDTYIRNPDMEILISALPVPVMTTHEDITAFLVFFIINALEYMTAAQKHIKTYNASSSFFQVLMSDA